LARAALDAAVWYANRRLSFGKPIGDYQALRFPIAGVAADIEAARFLTWRAAWLGDLGRRHDVETAQAKMLAMVAAACGVIAAGAGAMIMGPHKQMAQGLMFVIALAACGGPAAPGAAGPTEVPVSDIADELEANATDVGGAFALVRALRQVPGVPGQAV
jgi:alkylation response protein AidB-like acyl-CoA dehydrogenase